jgi:FlaA1/EpsC-like NDP-sugar epimerase
MGATKLLAEKLVASAGRQAEGQVFSSVRFGNVVGSRGSVLLIFERQVREGGPVTVTDPDMTRFIMAPSDSAELILRAANLARSGELFVLKMKAVRVGDLAEGCREFFSKLQGKKSADIRIERIGAKPGEKMHEELMNSREAMNAMEFDDFYVVNPHPSRSRRHEKRHGLAAREDLSSRDVPPLSVPEIVKLLSRL